MMKKLVITVFTVVIFNTIAVANEDRVLATYNGGGEVRESQVMQEFKPALDMQPANKDKKFADLDSAVQEALVRGYINMQFLNKAAKDSNIEASQEFQDKLSNIKTQLIRQEVLERYVASVVTDKVIDEEYKKFAEGLKGQKELKVSHILVETEDKAKEIKSKLNKGEKFGALAKKFSTDDGSKANNGELGYIMKGQLVPEFENKAFAMKDNEVSDPVKSPFGWHVIKVLGRRDAQVPTAETEKPNIKARLSREAIEKYFTDLSSKADIKLNLPKKEESAKKEEAANASDKK